MRKRSFSRLIDFMKPYGKKFITSISFSIIYTLARASQPFIIGLVISELAKNVRDLIAGTGGINFDYILKMVLLLVITSAIDVVGEYTSNFLLAKAVQDTTLDIRSAIYKKLNRLPVVYFDSRQQGEILSRVTTDVTVVSEAMQQTLLQVLSSILSLIFSIIFMFYLSPFFAIVTFIMFPFAFYVFKIFLDKTQPIFRKLQNALGELNGYSQEYYSGHQVTQLFGQEEKVIESFKKVNSNLNKTAFKANFISSTINPILGFITNFFYIGMFLFLALSVLNQPLILFGIVVSKQMAIGSVQAFIQYIWQASGPIRQITQLSNLFQTATASLGRVFEILDEEEEKTIEEIYDLDKITVNGNIEFSHVQFGYDENKLLMNDINIDIKSGDTVAIVGPTGAGKTTLINLLMRFYDINGGNIKIDGIDISKLTKKQSRSLFSIVDQRPWLYSATIEENIRFGKLDASYEEVVESAEIARADHFIRTLPDGYKTMINEETSNVSQGEKQLITIARALISDPEIIILDEATSSVDTRLEQLIQSAMDIAMEGRTSFIIAHRLSTIRNADLILVMENGSIVEQGNHEKLIEKNGVYKELYESQFA